MEEKKVAKFNHIAHLSDSLSNHIETIKVLRAMLKSADRTMSELNKDIRGLKKTLGKIKQENRLLAAKNAVGEGVWKKKYVELKKSFESILENAEE